MIILEKDKVKSIKIKGNASDDNTWFIENYSDIKSIYYFRELKDYNEGEIKFFPNKGGNIKGHYKFLLSISEYPEGDLPSIKLIYKNKKNEEDDKMTPKKIEIKVMKSGQKKKKNEKETKCEKIKKFFGKCNYKCNRLTIPIFVLEIIIQALSHIVLWYFRKIESDSIIAEKISDDLLNNFNFGYMTDLHKETLPINKEPEEANTNFLIFDKWQGTNPGCGRIINNNIDVKPLNDENKCDDNYEFLEPIPSIDIIRYRGFTLSATTPPNKKYYNMLYDGSIVAENEGCPEGKKSCGYIDTLYNILCLDKNSECPINYISIGKEPPPGIKNLKTLEGQDINIYYSNNPYEQNSTKIPYIQSAFKIAEDEICTAPSLYYSKLNLFKLDGFRKSYADKCVLTDYHQEITKYKGDIYHSLDIVDNFQLYKENKIIDKINSSKLIKYGYNVDMYKDNNLHLYVRVHYGFKKECLQKREKDENIMTQLNKMNGIADKMNSWSNKMKFEIGNIFASILEFVPILNWLKKDNAAVVEVLLKNLANFAFAIITTYFSGNALKYDDPCEEEFDCSDDYTNDNYNIMILKLRNNGKNIYISLWINIIILVCSFIIIVLRIIAEYMNRNQNI